MKRCPFCAEEIQDEAVKCRFCGEFLDKHRPLKRCLFGCLFSCIICLIVIIVTGGLLAWLAQAFLSRLMLNSSPFCGNGINGMVKEWTYIFRAFWEHIRSYPPAGLGRVTF